MFAAATNRTNKIKQGRLTGPLKPYLHCRSLAQKIPATGTHDYLPWPPWAARQI
jgi:hypothetical protein